MLDIRQRTGYLFLAVTVGHVILISSQVQSKSGVRVLDSVTLGVFARVQQGTSAVIHGVRNAWGSYIALRGVRAENQTLRSQVADLEVRLQEQRALAARTAKLQELLNLRASVSAPTLPAEVIAGNPNPGMMTVTIDRGAADGVQENMAVIAPTGVVGRIVGPPAAHAARVQLIIDRHAAAGAISERSRAGGMVVGQDEPGKAPLRMELVSNLADLKPGDTIVTSGVDGIYQKGFAIGRVETVERGTGLYLSVTVRPMVEFRSLEEVLVVMTPARSAVAEAAAEPGAGTPR
jgi:rod shape-determining protein MreC